MAMLSTISIPRQYHAGGRNGCPRESPTRVGTEERVIGDILNEVYQAVDGGQSRIAAMGIRAALEQMMIYKVGDRRTFEEKLDAFQAGGYISAVQRDAMRDVLHVGNATMHRGHLPTESNCTSLSISSKVYLRRFTIIARRPKKWRQSSSSPSEVAQEAVREFDVIPTTAAGTVAVVTYLLPAWTAWGKLVHQAWGSLLLRCSGRSLLRGRWR